MKTKRHLLTLLLMVATALCVFASPFTTKAASTDIVPDAVYNLSIEGISNSYLVKVDSGYMRVFYDSSSSRIGVEYYTSSFALESRKYISMDLSSWGGFYATDDAYYVFEGESNSSKKDTKEVLRVIKFNTSWKTVSTAKITSATLGGVATPFTDGTADVTDVDGVLYYATTVTDYNSIQRMIIVSIDTSSMTATLVDASSTNSAAQCITSEDTDVYVAEKSLDERATVLSKLDTTTGEITSASIYTYNGSDDETCYATVNGVEVSSSNVLTVGTAVKSSLYSELTVNTAHNVYVAVTDKTDISGDNTKIVWLTDYISYSKALYGVNITKISSNKFLVTWENNFDSSDAMTSDPLSGNTLNYVIIDGSGGIILSENTLDGPVSLCQPILNGSKVVYFASSENAVNFYSINTNTGDYSKKVHRVAGLTASWKISGTTLVVSGSGKINIDSTIKARYPISTCAAILATYLTDNCWTSLKSDIKKIKISMGITGIGASAFTYLSNVKTIVISDGVTSIGKLAFYRSCTSAKVTIPYSVKSIGTDCLWNGLYDGSKHDVTATIYCYAGSKAKSYAKSKKISYKEILAKKGEYYTSGGYIYKVTSVDSKGKCELTLTTGADGNTAKIPATVKINGKTSKVTAIAAKAFKKCTTIKSASIGKYVTTIGTSAFEGCTSLKKVTGCAGVTEIGKAAFKKCVALKGVGASSAVKLKKVEKIYANAFYGCTSITTVKLTSKNLKSIGGSAFRGCTSLKSFSSSSKVLAVIGANAFRGDSKLSSVVLKTLVLKKAKVGGKAFKGISDTCVFKVPKAMIADYTKIFIAKGAKKTIKVKS